MSFLRKYSAIADISLQEISKLVRFRTVYIGHPINIWGAKFNFYYSFHSIPTICFDVEYMGKKLFFSGDTYYDPTSLRKIQDQKNLFSPERFKEIAERDFNQYDLILHEAGIAPIHTPKENFIKWDKSVQDKLYLFHCNCESVKEYSSLKVVKPGLENSLILINEEDYFNNQNIRPDKITINNCFKSNLELLSGVDIVSWIPVKRMLDLLEVIHTVKYEANQLVLKAGTFGSRFYFVKKGRLKIYNESEGNMFEKVIYPGDYFGESAIFSDGYRLANVETETETILLEIEKFDFLWVFSDNSLLSSISENENDNDDQILPEKNLAPEMQLIKNLSNLRKAKLAEFINENIFVNGLNENQKCKINMFIKEKKTEVGEVLWKKGSKGVYAFFVKSGKYQGTNEATCFLLLLLSFFKNQYN